MIITKVPFRISFFGGGTDFPEWFNKNKGHVISTTFDKYCYVTCRPLPSFFDHKYRVTYSQVETTNTIDEIMLAPVREGLRFVKENRGMEIHYDADLPARTGLGTSSSFIVGLLHALNALKNQNPICEKLARDAIYLEREIIKDCVGFQDQIIAAHGGFNYIRFNSDSSYNLIPIAINSEFKARLNSHLLLFFTGISRNSSDISLDQRNNMKQNKVVLKEMSDLVDEAKKILEGQSDLNAFGELLDHTWKLKKTLSKRISSSYIDDLYSIAKEHGATGGKLLGAGAGGFFLVFANPEFHHNIIEALSPRIHIPFQFTSEGSKVILNHL